MWGWGRGWAAGGGFRGCSGQVLGLGRGWGAGSYGGAAQFSIRFPEREQLCRKPVCRRVILWMSNQHVFLVRMWQESGVGLTPYQ